MSLWEDTVLSPGRSHFGLNSILYLHKHSNVPVVVSALREPQLSVAAPWAVVQEHLRNRNYRGLNPLPLVRGTFAKIHCEKLFWRVGRGSVGKRGAPSPGWSQIHPNTHGWPHSRAVRSKRRFLLILMGFMPFAKLNAAWHEMPFFCPCFAQTGGVWCLLLAGIWWGEIKGKKRFIFCVF